MLQRGDGAVPKRLVIAGRGLAREPTILNRKRVLDYATAHEPASRSWRRREAASPSMIVAATESRWPRNAHASVLGRHISITASLACL